MIIQHQSLLGVARQWTLRAKLHRSCQSSEKLCHASLTRCLLRRSQTLCYILVLKERASARFKHNMHMNLVSFLLGSIVGTLSQKELLTWFHKRSEYEEHRGVCAWSSVNWVRFQSFYSNIYDKMKLNVTNKSSLHEDCFGEYYIVQTLLRSFKNVFLRDGCMDNEIGFAFGFDAELPDLNPNWPSAPPFRWFPPRIPEHRSVLISKDTNKACQTICIRQTNLPEAYMEPSQYILHANKKYKRVATWIDITSVHQNEYSTQTKN